MSNDITTKLAEALRHVSDEARHPDYDWPIWLSEEVDEALRLYDEAKAQPVQDERAAFEAWCKRIGFTTARNYEGDYLHGYGAELWSGWEARAALEQLRCDSATPAPAPHPDTQDAERYRWLRNESWGGQAQRMRYPCVIVFDGAGNRKSMLAEEAMDAAIDAAMLAGQGKEAGK